MAAGVVWLTLEVGRRNPDPEFHGRRESAWIGSLKYYDDNQTHEWLGFGREGVGVLVRGLERSDRPAERAYRHLYPRLPRFVLRCLPAPQADSTRSTRMRIVALLSGLGEMGETAAPAVLDAVIRDEDDSVRALAISYFNSSEDEHCLHNRLQPDQRQKLVHALLRDAENPQDWGLRNNAAHGLRYYPEFREQVVPVFVRLLQDSQPEVRLLAAEGLLRMDHAAAQTAGITAHLARIASHTNDQVAWRAVGLLEKPGIELPLAVPALVEALRSPSPLVSDTAVGVLRHLRPQLRPYGNSVLPALRMAAQRKDSVANDAQKEVEKWESAALPR
ncbi:MAG TPA: HEAT repeat domain-containing protein [Candidatus Limnocylindria bacterium]|nr:HEAT repeat domain-containing protein [Candidatus Limnocylindria bacterium]